MEYIVFGAGFRGIQACNFIGEARVLCFSDTYNFHREWYNKSVISFEEMVSYCKIRDDVALVIANEEHSEEMVQQLLKAGITRYCIYSTEGVLGRLPVYYLYRKAIRISLVQIFSRIDLSCYQCLGVYGDNELTPYVVVELWEQNPNADIRLISRRQRTGVFDLPVMDFEEAIKSVDCFVLNVRRSEDDIRERLSDAGIQRTDIVDIYEIDRLELMFHHPELERYKNLHKGKRCFLIGTGPSLTVDDLNILHKNKEICISCNKIYRVYDKTSWRADYIGFSDVNIIDNCKDELLNIPGTIFIADTFHSGVNKRIDGIRYYHAIYEEYYPNSPGFSDNMELGFFNGMTIIYDFGLQFAAYCGFQEIYLLGCDCSTVGKVTDSRNHFITDYFRDGEKKNFDDIVPCWEKIFKAYETAEKYSRKHGFRIFNATRGGNLEVFERVDFDALF